MELADIQRVKQQFGIIGNNTELIRAIDTAIQVAHTDLTVLITGESGVGKEFFPQIIHTNSVRKHGKYFAVNCGAIPEGTIDSELFGHVKGAFTDAVSERKGYFCEADGGTIFLDEVGELPLSTQARLLRVLENGEFLRVGSSKVEKTNVRIVCATNVNLPEAVSSGRFREDLYYRLNTVPIKVPALRDRGEDIFLLFKKFTMDFAAKYNIPRIELDEQAKRALLAYSWPGNIRQLKNVAEQVSILELNRKVTADVIMNYLPEQPKNNLPALFGASGGGGKTFESEREILYSVLFDMRRDITELKKQVAALTASNSRNSDSVHIYTDAEEVVPVVQHQQPTIHIAPQPSAPVHQIVADEYVEEALSLDDMEKKAIRQALERNRGRRRDAAKELNISERTLYRKIKEYGIE
ncbi:MAG: sigma-54-dependent Fis family transcriptional regulator [Bacteroidaceae bacterium]|nr:sigma-54-dependent Fis family transcriptional regulator [Bacteroidales bacterium]MBO5263111.1 sigma-54-dependent Fis family transcriptional regulator [Bacteroidaceae bacterium]MBQ8257240.1 sigma-54-dependent Fis family transcriptional regulator [Bacteroidaceae bacterium]